MFATITFNTISNKENKKKKVIKNQMVEDDKMNEIEDQVRYGVGHQLLIIAC